MPPSSYKGNIDGSIVSDVSAYLLPPKYFIGPWNLTVFGASMPVAPINENGDLFASENNVRLAYNSDIESITQADCP